MKAHFVSLRVACCLFFVILFSSCTAKLRFKKLCPQVLPDGPVSKNRFETEGRIINGNVAKELQPYMGALRSYGELICSATLLSEYWALTAGHCVFDPTITKFVTGGNEFDNGVEIDIEKGIVHELFPFGSESNIINDIQLIKLKTPVPSTARFVKLNTKGSIPSPTAFVRTAGYGDTLGTATPSSGILRQVDIPVQPMSVCKKQYGADINIFRAYHICAGYVRGGCDSCSGDSGGPLFIFDNDLNVIQVGIVSFGFGCAEPDASGVYTRLSFQIEWLRRKRAKFDTSGAGVNIFSEEDSAILIVEPSRNATETIATPLPTAATPKPKLTPTPTPKPIITDSPDAQVAPSSDRQCFPGSAEVRLENGVVKRMSDLQIGDSVMVTSGKFSKVFMFTHRVTYGSYKFVRLAHSESFRSSPSQMILTRGHLLLLNGVYKPAASARVGDFMELGNGTRSVVRKVENVWEKGLYNPQTIDGRIIVNNVVASTYTTAVDLYTAHAVLAPLRYMFWMSGRDVSGGVLEGGL